MDAQRGFIDQQLATDTPWGLGRALHATKDADAAAHSGFREWDGELTLAHVLTDLFPSRQELWEAFLHDLALIERWKKTRCR